MATALQASPFRTKNSFYNSQPPPLAHAPHFAGAGQATVAEFILSNSQEAPLNGRDHTDIR
jgi:hypothetical protein